MPGSDSGLRREVGLRDLVLFNIAAVVGVRWLAAAAHTGAGSITLWLSAAALFFVPSALAVARLSSACPEEGGIYRWTARAFGPWHGFLCGWCYWLSNLFYFPNLMLAGAGMVAYAFGWREDTLALIASSLAVLWITLLANLAGVSVGKWAGNAGGISTYAVGALLAVTGMLVWIRTGPATELDLLPAWSLDKLNFWPQIAFAFAGLELGAVMGGEIRDPERTSPRAAWISCAAIALFYSGGTLAMLVALPPGRITPFTGLVEVARASGQTLAAPWLLPLMAALIGLGAAGQLSAWVGASARIPFAIGMDRYLPAAFGRLHPRWRTPHVAILTQGIACTVFFLALQAGESARGAYQVLVDMTVITTFVPYLYMFAAAWKHSRTTSALSGLGVTALALVLSLVPPPEAASPALFELKIVGGCLLLVAAARVIFLRARRAGRNR